MANQELLQYIKQQLSLGETKERITKILLDAGWVEGDIKEAMGLVSPASSQSQSANVASTLPSTQQSPVAKPMQSSPIVATQSPLASTMSQQKPMERPIASLNRTSGPATFSVQSPFAEKKDMKDISAARMPVETSIHKLDSFVASANNARAKSMSEQKTMVTPVTQPHRASRLPLIALIVLALVLAGFSAKLFFDTSDLTTQIQQLEGDKSVLIDQLTKATQKSGDTSSQLTTLTADNTDLLNQVSLFVVPTGTGGTTSKQEIPVTIGGVLSGGDTKPYILTTSKGIVVTIKNGKDVKIDPILKTFVDKQVDLTGTHIAGSLDVVIKTLNGNPIP